MQRYLLGALITLTSLNVTARTAHYLDQNMTGPEYRSLFAVMEKDAAFHNRIKKDALAEILEIGKRNLDWIALINSKRDDAHKLQLTTPETEPSYPINTPGKSNRQLIMQRLSALKESMPAAMKNVIFSHDNLPDNNPLDDQTFLSNAFTLNRIYEAASRWLLQEPDLAEYKNFKRLDIRGYYFLKQEPDLPYNLQHWSTLNDTTKRNYTNWLIGECMNQPNEASDCQAELNAAITSKKVYDYHQKYVYRAEKLFNEYFEVVNPRPEAIWNHKNPDIMELPFTTPVNPDVQQWFKFHVEDEFHFGQWSLKINYSNNDYLAKVIFEPGVTPHVNYLGGDTITMDANRSLQEYEPTWVIRHEFGHILGLPDCYVEFYDESEGVMINYQIDTTNLMCSRRGHLQAQHVEQLKKHYYKG